MQSISKIKHLVTETGVYGAFFAIFFVLFLFSLLSDMMYGTTTTTTEGTKAFLLLGVFSALIGALM